MAAAAIKTEFGSVCVSSIDKPATSVEDEATTQSKDVTVANVKNENVWIINLSRNSY